MSIARAVPRATLEGATPRAAPPESARREQLTFRGNLKSTRHGWLRLTPAYSVRLVDELLGDGRGPVLDPFCGTGTTLLACAERGVDGATVDINPFLVWLARAKIDRYPRAELTEARRGLGRMQAAAASTAVASGWVPALHQIDKWWSPEALAALSRAHAALERFAGSASRPASNLLRIAFCQVLIAASRAFFGHQSMSFQPATRAAEPPRTASDAEAIADGLRQAFERVALAAAQPLSRAKRRVLLGDARLLHQRLPPAHFSRVITSPPYANRMSYIRELRPYMYWLGYLEQRSSAGALDWRAIGGTWGAATSKLTAWRPEGPERMPVGLAPLLEAIAQKSPLLSTYVRKYFHDMAAHLGSLLSVLRPGGTAHFVVGNSKFYEVVVPVEQLLADQFQAAGFARVRVDTLRKRSSKKELYEYLISAEKP